MKQTMTAKELMARLQRHYIKPGEGTGGVFIPEVTHGSAGNRRADAIYIGFYQSRGRFAVGHELKVSRSDWVHELEQHEKAEAWVMDTHQWYVVAPSEEIVRREELPEGWGLMVVDPRTTTRLRIVEKARLYPERDMSWQAAHAIVQKVEYGRVADVAAAHVDALETIRRVATALRIPKAWASKSTAAKMLERIQATTNALADVTNVEILREQLAAEKEVVAQLAQILGVKAITRDNWDREDAPSIETVRSEFSAWLAARLAGGDAILGRAHSLQTARESLARAVEQVDKASAALAGGSHE